MFRRIHGLYLALILIATQAVSGSLTVESETVIRSFERPVGTETDRQILPIHEYLTLDVEQLGSKYLSLHAYGWGRFDSTDSGYYDDPFAGELIYGYLECADTFQRRSLRLGRQHIFEGVANETIDGLRLTSDLGNQLSLSVYGGLPVGLENTAGRNGDAIWGGRVALHVGSFSDIGVSYKTIDNDGATVSSRLGVDSAFFLPMNISLYGNSVRNMETQGWAEHSYELRVDAEDVGIRPYYEMFRYADYFDAGPVTAGPFIFLAGTDEQLDALGVDVDWRRSESWTFGAKAKNYNYELRDSSIYVSASVSWSGEAATQAGGEVGYMQGDAADSNYVLIRFFCYLDQPADRGWVDFVSGDVLCTLYDEDIYGQDYSYFLSLGSGKKFLNDDLEIKLSADYSGNPYFESDLRAMLTATYRFGVGS